MNAPDSFQPSYLRLLETGELADRVRRANAMLSACTVCPRVCRIDRRKGERGFCRTGAQAMVSSFAPHPGEERPLSGTRGSGTIFFTNCNLSCMYCQNYDISQLGSGREVTAERLSEMMLTLQGYGCHNINLVTPSHVIPQIIQAIHLAAQAGLALPIVYNTSSYDALDSLGLLEDVVDIYLADLKYTDNEIAGKYSRAPDYAEVGKAAIREMFRQAGDLIMDEQGIARRGLMIRHLVLPNDLSGTEEAMRFLAEEVSRNTFVNLMSQYRPSHRADESPYLNRRLRRAEFDIARTLRAQYGLSRGEVQRFWGM